jgi:hypothetical protein
MYVIVVFVVERGNTGVVLGDGGGAGKGGKEVRWKLKRKNSYLSKLAKLT